MTASLAHRGPDGSGTVIRGEAGLGHRRLAIIDLESGRQPIGNEDGTVQITCNGEIYNYVELRHELQQKGHRFATRSDTEVVVHAYEEWGLACVQRLRGMFAFALADFAKRRLVLARDHFGIKPLYYRLRPGRLTFASELSALRRDGAAPPAGSLQAIELYLRFQYIPTPHTIYRDVFKLPPASLLVLDFDGRTDGPTRYWDFQFQPETYGSDLDWETSAEAAIREAVKAHLVADVPFGVFLSGGIDSTIVASQMAQLCEAPVKAFAIGFEEPGCSELAYAEQAARQYGCELYTEVIGEDAIDALPALVAHYGEPFGDSSALPTWHVSRLARGHVKMLLSGDGGDEAFGGYASYAAWMANGSWRPTLQGARHNPSRALRRISRLLQRRLLGRPGNDLSLWQDNVVFMGAGARQALWRPEHQPLVSRPCALFEGAARRARSWDPLSFSQYLDYQTFLPCDILTKVDVASMFHGLEVRTPLIDLRILELVARLPVWQRCRQNGSGHAIGKYLPKRLLARTFPAEFVHREKQGFVIPRARWLRPGRRGRLLLDQVLGDSRSRLYEFFRPEQIRARLAVHDAGQDASSSLWLLLVLGLWLDQNADVSFD
jgi:asparagine synthase (glutamine-hydrolysing)